MLHVTTNHVTYVIQSERDLQNWLKAGINMATFLATLPVVMTTRAA